MNEQEAIKELKKLQSGEAYDTEYIDFECFDKAISALEKQVPKKIFNRQELKDFHGRCYRLRGNCPECTSVVLQSSFCEWCGQKLDWVEPYSEDSL